MKIKDLINKLFNKKNVVAGVAVSAALVAGINVNNQEEQKLNDEPLTVASLDRAYAEKQRPFLLAATPASMRWTWEKSDQYVSKFAIDSGKKTRDAKVLVLNDAYFCDNANDDYIVDLIRQAKKKARENNQNFDFCYKSQVLGPLQEKDKAHQEFIKSIDEEIKEKTPKDLNYKRVKLGVE